MLKKLLGVALLLSIAGNIYLFIEVNKLNKSLNQTVSAETRTTISNQAPEQSKRETVKTVITTENPIGQQQTIAALVLNKDYYGAVNKLAEASEQLRAKYLEKWLKAVAELINDDKFTDAEQFLQAILQDYPDNLPALKLNVELLLAQKMTKEAVFASYNIRHHVFDIKQEDAIINDARKLALSEAMRLKSLKAWQLQKTFAQDVLSIDFNFERMQLVLANAEYRLREYNHAQSLALSLVDNPELTT